MNKKELKEYRSQLFIERATERYGDKFDYSESVYKNVDEHIKIKCKIHGEFTTTPYRHLQNKHSCPECGKEFKRNKILEYKIEIGIVDEDTPELYNVFCEKHQQKFKYSKNNKTCPICREDKNFLKRKEVFLEKLHNVYRESDKYTFDEVDYTDSYSKIRGVCKNHGEFFQYPSYILKGINCQKCGEESRVKSSRRTLPSIIDKINEVHGNSYKYPQLEKDYNENYPLITVICKQHGQFKQKLVNHLTGSGCKECGNLKVGIKNAKHSSGWSLTKWTNNAKISKSFFGFSVYIIRCWDENEEFYKIGRTFRKIEKRFLGNSKLPYEYEVLHVFTFVDPKNCFDYEVALKRENKQYAYIPLLKFNGRKECFNKIEIINDKL